MMNADVPRPFHIVVVNDEPALIALMSEVFSDRGYHVTAFTDPLAALAACKLKPQDMDILVTDQTMPNLTGLELIRELRRLRPTLPVILASGYSDVINAKTAAALGVSHFLAKPYRMHDLAQRIATLLEEHNG